MRRLKEVIVYWSPETKQVFVGPFPEQKQIPNHFYSWGGCNIEVREEKSKQKQIGRLFVEIQHWVIREGISPQDIHSALWGVQEYRDGLSLDVPEPTKKAFSI